MITKLQVKHIQSLRDKKIRLALNEFIVEGIKIVEELLVSSFEVKQIFAIKSWIDSHAKSNFLIQEITEFELQKISCLKTPNAVVAIAALPKHENVIPKKVSLVLDSIQDPGNVGSIIRIADWFGIETVYVNEHCADAFNEKVVQATMGGIFRVKIIQEDFEKLFSQNKHLPVYAATLNGKPLNEYTKIKQGFILLGNESKGINQMLQSLANHQLTISKIGEAESLNVAVAAGIICDRLLS
jgi:RNA methyltransferase, TrmH family